MDAAIINEVKIYKTYVMYADVRFNSKISNVNINVYNQHWPTVRIETMKNSYNEGDVERVQCAFINTEVGLNRFIIAAEKDGFDKSGNVIRESFAEFAKFSIVVTPAMDDWNYIISSDGIIFMVKNGAIVFIVGIVCSYFVFLGSKRCSKIKKIIYIFLIACVFIGIQSVAWKLIATYLGFMPTTVWHVVNTPALFGVFFDIDCRFVDSKYKITTQNINMICVL